MKQELVLNILKGTIGRVCNTLAIREQKNLNLLEITVKIGNSYKIPFICSHIGKQLRLCKCIDILTVHYPTKHKNQRFQISYFLLSIATGIRIRIRIFVSEHTTVPSITSIFPSANWLERENYDMFGILFGGHPDLRRILTDYGFVGFPLRKDFPTSGYQECFYGYKQKHVVYKPIKLTQFSRTIVKTNPWILKI